MARKEKQIPLVRQTITLIGEGLTEQYYFKHIREIFGYRFVIKPYYFGTTSIKDMNRKIEEVISGNGIAICVFDADVSARDEAEKKKLTALYRKFHKRRNVVFCDSMPSIEYWFLIHFTNTNKYFVNSRVVENELLRFIPNYCKTKEFLAKDKWVKTMCSHGKMENAMNRAKTSSPNSPSYSNLFKAFESF